MTAPSLQGSLESFKLPEVLTFLNTTHKSGTLTVASGARETGVYFENGALVFAGSNQENLRLGDILLRKKKMSRAESQQIDALMRSESGRFGKFAVQQGVLTDDQLRDFLKIQTSEILFDCFQWKSGTFTFTEEMRLPSYAITISVDLSNLIMEGARRIGEWEEVVHLLPDKDARFRVAANPDSEKITLSLDEWKILFLINGQRTLQELCSDSEEEPLRVYRVVWGLYANKLIEPVQQTASGDETFKQEPVNFAGESTVREMSDDTNLLVSSDARLSYKDVAPPTVSQITVANGDAAGRVIPLTENEYAIGRQRDNTIQLGDLGVSGHHARIYRGPDGFVIEDLRSRNGTWVNGVRVYHTSLQNGDVIRVGATDLHYQVLYGGATP